MPDNDIAVHINNLTKIYKLYDDPFDRLRESLHPFRKKYHKEFYALENVSFTVQKGETLGIIGKNGAGKSTLLKILTGVLTPSSGSIVTNGVVSALLELGAGFNPDLSGLDNVFFSGMILGYSKEEMAQKKDDILCFADIGDYVYQPVKTYSSGMFARLAFSVAVNVDPDILIVDEVLSVGDMRFQQKSIRKMNEFREKGKTILFVTHDNGVVNKFCTRVIWLDNGRILKDGTPEKVTKNYASYMVYGLDSNQKDKDAEETPQTPVVETDIQWSDTVGHESFGEGGAKIYQVALCDENNRNISLVEQGQQVNFYAKVKVFKDLYDVALGITVKDRLGNNIFTINSFVYNASIDKMEKGYDGRAGIRFIFPKLAVGLYSVSVAIAEGTYMAHVQQDWIHDVLFVDVISPDGLDGTGCMMAIPAESVEFQQ
jgi:ABC-type polysaccharide/polyol phosphate transport system ATPase subunit